MKAPNPLAGRLLVLLVALLWSTSGLFVKAPIFDSWPADVRGLLLAFWRAAFAAILLTPMIRRPRFQWKLIPLAGCFAGMNVTYLTAMTLTTAANAIWLQNIAPWWVFLFSVVLLHEPIVRRDLIPLVFGLLGVGTILWFELTGVESPQVTGLACGVVSGVFYAGVVVCMRLLSSENSPWLVAFCHWVAAAVLLPVVLRTGIWPTPTQLLVLAGFGTFQMALPYILLIRALRAINSQEAVAIGLVEPVMVPLWVLLVWHEVPAWWTAVGGGLILAGLVLRYIVLVPRSPRGFY